MPFPPREGAGGRSIEPDTVLTGRAWWEGRLQPVEVGCAEGWIVRVGRSVPGGRRRDLGDSVLMPAAVDLHVHFRDPGPPASAESFATGTIQAVHGGVGVVVDMPNTVPPVRDRDAFETKADRARGRAACDVVLYGLAETPGRVSALSRIVGGWKLYTSPTTGIPEPPDAARWRELFAAVRTADLPISVHAEDPGRFGPEPGRTGDLEAWDAARPPGAERSAVEAVLSQAGPARLHIAHVTQAPLVEEIRAAGYSAEVTPHHLLLSRTSRKLGTHGKVNPPLRDEATRAALFESFRDGRIPVLASDHAPHAPERKAEEFPRAPSGVPGVETMLPLFLARVARGELPLPVLHGAVADRPARWLGLPMGRIAPGHRADLLVVDFRRRERLRAERLHAPAAHSPFVGHEVVFPTRHFRDGEPIVEDGEYVGRPNGRVLRPEYARS